MEVKRPQPREAAIARISDRPPPNPAEVSGRAGDNDDSKRGVVSVVVVRGGGVGKGDVNDFYGGGAKPSARLPILGGPAWI